LSRNFYGERIFVGRQKEPSTFRVQSIETLPSPVFGSEAIFQTLSPVTVSVWQGNKQALYVSPDAGNYGELLIKNLKEKY
jgi:CRISPR/Cas system endoribonuclease Cas6 (RAMP superfamily)